MSAVILINTQTRAGQAAALGMLDRLAGTPRPPRSEGRPVHAPFTTGERFEAERKARAELAIARMNAALSPSGQAERRVCLALEAHRVAALELAS